MCLMSHNKVKQVYSTSVLYKNLLNLKCLIVLYDKKSNEINLIDIGKYKLISSKRAE